MLHSDIAALQADCPGYFLIPCAEIPDNDYPIVCFGYQRQVTLSMVQRMYNDIPSAIRPDLEEYRECFVKGRFLLHLVRFLAAISLMLPPKSPLRVCAKAG